jgi:hypothetical protein
MKKQLVHLLCVATLLASSVCFGNIVVNGDFEDSSLLPAWSSGGPTGSWVALYGRGGLAQYFPGAQSGTQCALFNTGGGPSGGFIQQYIPTVSGWTYELSFYVGRGGYDPGGMVIHAALFDSSDNLLSSLTAGSPGRWGWGACYALNFQATTSSTRLRFTDVSWDCGVADALLDNVVVNIVSVPEPATLLLLGLGGLVLRRGRK